MARNRKNQSAAVRFGPAIKAFLICLIFAGSAVGYVWQKSQINDLGKQIKLREVKLTELENQNKKLRDQIAMLRSPAKLDERVRELNLGLAMPQPNQVWRMAEPLVNPPGANATPYAQIASQQVRTVRMQ